MSFIPPKRVAEAARRGLELRRSLPASKRCCTAVGIRRAVQLSNRQPVSERTLERMVSYFARHEVDKQGKRWGIDSKGYQAWLLWGGDVGRDWAEGLLEDSLAANPEFDSDIEEILADIERREQVLEALLEKGPHPFVAPFRYEDGVVLFHPDLERRGAWRATYFDEHEEPYGHRESETWERLVRSLASDVELDEARAVER